MAQGGKTLSLDLLFTTDDGQQYSGTIKLEKLGQVPQPEPEPQNRYFVLTYNDPMAVLNDIAITKPAFVVVASGQESRADVVKAYHDKGLKILAYIAEGYGSVPVNTNLDRCKTSGFDGVFMDECNPGRNDYNKNVYDRVKAWPRATIVIVNPGGKPPNGDIFKFADIVSTENFWFMDMKDLGQPASKLLSVQGDPGGQTDPRFQTPNDLQSAVSRLNAARKNGMMWYYPGYQNTHWKLPPYLADFAKAAR